MAKVIVHGIPNCDTVKKARKWLDARGVAHRFHDFRKDGVDAAMLTGWAAEVGWETLLNRAGTSFRALPGADKAALDEGRAIALMVAHPALIKRPVVTGAGPLLVGFKPDRYDTAFG